MKTKLTLLVMLIATIPAFSQTEKVLVQKKSNLETFSELAGSFSKKEFIPIGKVKGVTIEVIKITDLVTQKLVTGIKFSGVTGTSYSTTKSAFLDKDEIANFLRSIAYANEKVFNSPSPENSIEYNYRSRSGFSGGVFNSKGEWGGYLSMDNYNGSTFFLKKDDFQVLGDLVQKAEQLL